MSGSVWGGYDNGCPCKGCTERKPGTGCHDRCEQFKAWKEKEEKKKEAKREAESTVIISDAKRKAIWRSQRYGRNLWNPHHGSKK